MMLLQHILLLRSSSHAPRLAQLSGHAITLPVHYSSTTSLAVVQADKNAGLAREAALLEGKCQLKAALSSALESKAEVEAALQAARLDQHRLQQEVSTTILPAACALERCPFH